MTRQRQESAKQKLKSKGWSYRTAAPVLECSFEHLCRVLNGQRESRSLLRRIDKLPKRQSATR